jgi:pilus assembly protein CpaB
VARRRIVIIAVAALAGLLAASAAYAYLQGADARAYNGAQLVQVFKVAKDIPKGMGGDEAIAREFVRADKVPTEFRPGSALTDLGALKGKVSLTNLTANQVVVDGMFVDPRVAQVTAAQRIPAGNVAITVSTDAVHGVANLLVPGDKVNVLVKTDGAQRTLLQNVPVLFIGSTAAPEAGDTAQVINPGSDLITFAVPAAEANRIAYASQEPGGLYLTLVPPDNQPVDMPAVNGGNLFNGPLTPEG